MINRTITVAMSVYLEMVSEQTFYEGDTFDDVLQNVIYSSGNSGNSILSLQYLNKNAVNQGAMVWN